ncbi:MAG: bifunctional oligoribonuclease/PAP phosphatase NrnA [Vulcanimicrobiota bacterium]
MQDKIEHLRRLFTQKDRVGIIIIPDPDSIASAFAFQTMIKHWVHHCETIHLTETQRLDNRAMLRLLKLKYKPFRQVDLSRYSKFVMLDGQPSHNPLLSNLSFSVIIDHHPSSLEQPVPFTDIRVNYGATASIMTEYLLHADIRITPRLATALYYAIKTDTDMFRRTSSHHDLNILGHLLPKIKIGVMRMIEGSEIPRTLLKYISKALADVSFHKSLAYVHIGNVERDEICPILADFLLRIKGIDWSIVSATMEKHLTIVLRSWRERKDVGKLAVKTFLHLGKAGGHRYAARAEVPLTSIPEKYTPLNADNIGRFILDSINSHHRPEE